MKTFVATILIGFSLLGVIIPANAANSVAIIHNDADAYSLRLKMIRSAQAEILVEYYSFGEDEMALTIMSALVDAARRGVHVQLIADDLTRKLSKSFFAAMLNAAQTSDGKQNLEIKIYNPFQLNLFTLSSRDHAKMLVIDRKTAFVGGRNIGEKYFGVGDKVYLDLDTLLEGPVVADLVKNFFSVFESKSVSNKILLYEFSADQLDSTSCLNQADNCELQRNANIKQLQKDSQKIQASLQNIEQQIFKYSRGVQQVHFTNRKARLLSHRPDKLVSQKSADMTNELNFLMAQTAHELKIITPYLVLSEDQIEIFRSLIRQGKKVRILTNSMKSGDDLNALTAYRADREMLRALGVEVNEFDDTTKVLHAKVIIIDETISIIGTYNFDPRSAYINREIGILFQETKEENPLAQEMTSFFNELLSKSNKVIYNNEIHLDPLEDEIFTSKQKKIMKVIEFLLPLVRDSI